MITFCFYQFKDISYAILLILINLRPITLAIMAVSGTLNIILTCIQTFLSILSIIACIWLFWSWRLTKIKTLGLNLVGILGIGDFIAHIGSIPSLWQARPPLIPWFIQNSGIMFSVLWGSVIAYLTYQQIITNFQKKNFEIFLLLTSILSILIVTR